MAIRAQSERRFERASPVARYWLAQCEGFRVRGPVRGTVEEVVGAVDTQSAQRLVVRRAGRRRTVPVAAIDAVVPAERLIVVGGPPEAGRRTFVDVLRAVVLVVAAVAASFVRVLLRTTRGAAILSAHAVADARERWQAAARKRRRASSRRPRTSSTQDRKFTRADVLGVNRRGGQRP